MTRYRQLKHVESGRVLLGKVRWCDTFSSKFWGFTLRRQLTPEDGLVLVEKTNNRVNTAIHMLFVFCELGVIWVNQAGEVVDTVLAKPWGLAYAPKAPARYVIETHPTLLDQVKTGDHVEFLEDKEVQQDFVGSAT
jgi:uncharacterized membrane protein (UPF0127 family)